jgi:hypothetical protein
VHDERRELWRMRLDRAIQRLPDDTPEWAKALMDITLEAAVAQINHTDANTRMALQEQDERLKDTIVATKAELIAQIDELSQAVHLHDGAFEVMETLLEQNHRLTARVARWVRWIGWGLATLALIVILETLVWLGGIVLRPHELVWFLALVIAAAGAVLLGWMWKRRPGPRDAEKDLQP